MSKRHSIAVGGEPLPQGCRFYAPLTQDDVSDHVSGTIPTNGGAPVSWDSGKNAWHVAQTTGGTQLGWIYNHPNINLFSTPYTYTYVAKVFVNSFNGTCDVLTIGKSGDERYAKAFMETHRFTGFAVGRWYTIWQTLNEHDLRMYLDSTCVRTATTPSSYGANYPGKWTTADMLDNLTIAGAFKSPYGSYNYYADFYVKEVWGFDRVLTTQEVMIL